MNKKLITVFIIITFIPVALLTYLGILNINNENTRNQHYYSLLYKPVIEEVNKNLSETINKLEKDFLKLKYLYKSNASDIRDIIKENYLIRQIFIIDKSGNIVYPLNDDYSSSNEKDFFIRTKDLGISQGLFFKTRKEGSSSLKKNGWLTWFSGDGLNFIYWQLVYDNKNALEKPAIIGIELNRIALISHIIKNLPVTDLKNDNDFRVTIKNINNNTIYQWGNYQPDKKSKALVSLNMSEPFISWQINYFMNPASVNNNKSLLLISILIVFLILFIIFLSFYFYKESTREIRDAFQKVNFVNQVSHELKTPLTNIKIYSELVAEQLEDININKKIMKHLNIIISESSRLARLINNVLNFAKDQNNTLKFNPQKYTADNLILNIIDNFKLSLESNNIEIIKDLNCNKELFIDKDILEQVLSNLINNVEKYAASGKYIKISSNYKNNIVNIIVEDKGPGIPNNMNEKIFAPFFRISNKLTDGVSGTGIGLSIVKKLVKLHKGSAVLLKSKTGARFLISLYAPESRTEQ